MSFFRSCISITCCRVSFSKNGWNKQLGGASGSSAADHEGVPDVGEAEDAGGSSTDSTEDQPIRLSAIPGGQGTVGERERGEGVAAKATAEAEGITEVGVIGRRDGCDENSHVGNKRRKVSIALPRVTVSAAAAGIPPTEPEVAPVEVAAAAAAAASVARHRAEIGQLQAGISSANVHPPGLVEEMSGIGTAWPNAARTEHAGSGSSVATDGEAATNALGAGRAGEPQSKRLVDNCGHVEGARAGISASDSGGVGSEGVGESRNVMRFGGEVDRQIAGAESARNTSINSLKDER